MGRLRTIAMLLLAVTAIGCASRTPPRTAPEAPPASQPAAAAAATHTVQAGETLWSLSRRYGVSVGDIIAANGLDDPNRLEVGDRLVIPALEGDATWAWPVAGAISSRYGVSRGSGVHRGLDIDADRGDPVLAAWGGTVVYADSGMRDYGRVVIIDHGDGLSSLYAHNSELLVRRGDRVDRGERIARAGDTGNARGVHVHFEVRRNNRPIDPLPFLARSGR